MRYRALAISSLAVALGVSAGWMVPANASNTAPAEVLVAATPPVVPDDAPLADTTALQSIADANGGLRAHGRPGFKASMDFLKGKLDGAGLTTSLQTFTYNGATGYNLIAEWPYGDANNVIMSGAHVDSVNAGAGINDNGSGTAAVLETALAVAKQNLRPDKRMRFGFWGAEELGLVGSKNYVQSLPAAERSKINVYLNFDMVGTKNIKAWGIYQEGPDVAAQFTKFFTGRGLATKPIDPAGRSDHGSFARYGIKVTGISSESDLNHLEPCYHQACDTRNNVDAKNMALAANSIVTVMWNLAGAKVIANAPTGTPTPTSSPTGPAPQSSTPAPAPSPTSTRRPRPPWWPW